ncbi:hypothetical protein B0H10DRAFT_2007919 [Mycena sp. CBHHK59/15]|nr:hypothetical protein B0H10DRAFT_2007919 [Mycena sp. CBHHK59/15]
MRASRCASVSWTSVGPPFTLESNWYSCELVDTNIFLQWVEGLAACRPCLLYLE